ncbi:MAG: hypothetical protein AABZ39_15390 [Spirochaetota bacterium]
MNSSLNSENQELKERVSAYRDRIADMEKKLDYTAKIVLLYENILQSNKEEAKELDNEIQAREHTLELARKELLAAYEEIRARESVSDLARRELVGQDKINRLLKDENEYLKGIIEKFKKSVILAEGTTERPRSPSTPRVPKKRAKSLR